MTEFSQLLDVLREAIAQPPQLPALVPKFQDLVWNSEICFPSQKAEDVLRDLAYDLPGIMACGQTRDEVIARVKAC